MIILSPKVSDKKHMYSFFNTNTSIESKVIDMFFKVDYDPSDFLIFKNEEKILCVLKFREIEYYLHGYTNEAYLVERVYYARSCPLDIRKKFIDACFKYFSYFKLLTFVSDIQLSHPSLEDVFFKKRYKLYRKDLYNVNGYILKESINIEEMKNIDKKFDRHFSGYQVKDESYYESKAKYLKQSEALVYSCLDSNNEIIGYIVYNYLEGEIIVEEIVYLDTLSLLTLLTKAMGLNEYIKIDVSRSEVIDKVFGELNYEIVSDVLCAINDKRLFNRLYATQEKTLEGYVSSIKRSIYFSGYIKS